MTIELSHVGEPLVAQMLSTLAEREKLARVRCAATGTSLAADLVGDAPEFIADRALLRVHGGECIYACDGAQTVDVLGVAGGAAVAIELKLGVTRMTNAAFRERFCGTCSISGHRDPRLRGSMVAVLDRLLPFAVDQIAAVDGQRSWPLADHWWLVVRQPVWESWGKQLPVQSARILVFDELARLYGSTDDFDQLVRSTVGSDFAARWQIQFEL